MISMDKKYRTRDGREVRIYAVDGENSSAIHGAVYYEDHGWLAANWYPSGVFSLNGLHAKDLIEVRPRIKREVWVNVYPISASGFIGSAYNGKDAADINAVAHRIACVKLTIDCEEGEGLTHE